MFSRKSVTITLWGLPGAGCWLDSKWRETQGAYRLTVENSTTNHSDCAVCNRDKLLCSVRSCDPSQMLQTDQVRRPARYPQTARS